MHMRVVYLPLLTVPGTSVRAGRNMSTQLLELSMPADDEAEQVTSTCIDFVRQKWEIPITVEVCAANCRQTTTCVCVFVYVHLCVCDVQYFGLIQ